MMGSENLRLGELCSPDAQRDACHVAVVPVTAAMHMRPGDHVGIAEGTQDQATFMADPIGVVDPFLKNGVMKGSRFLLWLYPGTVTGMRHHWSHPAFPEEVKEQDALVNAPRISDIERQNSVTWMTEFADSIGLRYDRVMDVLERNVESGYYHCFGTDTPDEVYEHSEKMWEHYEKITGKFFDDGDRPDHVPFRCAC